MGGRPLFDGGGSLALSAGWGLSVLLERGSPSDGTRRCLALDVDAKERSDSGDRKYRSDEKRGSESWLLAGTAMARTGPDDRSMRGSHRLLVQYAEVSRSARSKGSREYRISAYFGKRGDACGCSERT